jgi:hypothetical protein
MMIDYVPFTNSSKKNRAKSMISVGGKKPTKVKGEIHRVSHKEVNQLA